MRAFLALGLFVFLGFAAPVRAEEDPVLNEACGKLGVVKMNTAGTAMFGCVCEVADTCYNGQATNLRWKMMTAVSDPVRQMQDHYGLSAWPAYIVCYTPSYGDGGNVKYTLLMHYYATTGREQGFDPADLAPVSAFSHVTYGPVVYNADGSLLLGSNGKISVTAATAGCPARLALDGRTIQYP